MRIGINALAVSPERPGGDVSYVLELVRRLPAMDPAIEWAIFVAPWSRALIGELPANARCVLTPVPRGSLVVRALWEQTALVPLAMRQRLDVLFAPVNVLPIACHGKMALTLHEAEPFMPASLIPLPLLAWWRVMRRLSARRADRILTVSEAARADLVRWMGIPWGRIEVIHLGVDLDRFSIAAKASPPPLEGAPYVLWVGRNYPRKNVDTLLTAFAELQKMGRPERLVLIGPPGWNEAALQRRISSEFQPGSIVRLPGVWSDLPRWYAHASVFAFLSTQETFGLPVLEAMACGTPVLAADIPALRDVAGTAAEFVRPLDVAEVASRLIRLLTDNDPDRQERRRTTGLQRAAQFTWAETARRTHAAICIG